MALLTQRRQQGRRAGLGSGRVPRGGGRKPRRAAPRRSPKVVARCLGGLRLFGNQEILRSAREQDPKRGWASGLEAEPGVACSRVLISSNFNKYGIPTLPIRLSLDNHKT